MPVMRSISALRYAYWNTHKQDKAIIYSNGENIELDKLSDIKYLSFDINNTLSIHKKGWDQKTSYIGEGFFVACL